MDDPETVYVVITGDQHVAVFDSLEKARAEVENAIFTWLPSCDDADPDDLETLKGLLSNRDWPLQRTLDVWARVVADPYGWLHVQEVDVQ